tara:strand:+ start:602 stop:775 length:174 start_codon:yes stop_codon:yes gene_type:complete
MEERKKPMTTIDPEDPYEYPMELMGEHPPVELFLSYNKKSSKLKEDNSENLCADTEG